jgi:excisionase family DNA binding protein
MTTEKHRPDLLTASEAARLLRVSRQTVYRRCTTGDLPALRVGRQWRIARPEITEWKPR